VNRILKKSNIRTIDDHSELLTDYDNKDKKEKTEEIIILIFPYSRKDKE
jgi:hypothetical protein